MASSSSRKKKKNENEGTPHFFKIIFDDSLSQLAIPRKFVQIYGGFLASPVKLKVPSGAKWKIEAMKSEGQIWLHNGWREFAEYYSVVEGSFLVFEFVKSDCQFNVTIFDMTASEIDYPLDFDQEQIHQQPHKNKSCNVASENPSFKIVMQPSFLLKRAALVIPPSFARNYLNKNGVAVLKVFDGTTWFVNYYSRKASRITKTRIEHSGWEKFVNDNHLQVGDVCIFELIDPVQTTFRVAISKYSNAANLRISLGNGKESIEKESRSKEQKVSFSNRRDAKEDSNKITYTNLSFGAKISSTSLRRSTVYVPGSFIKNIKRETKHAKLKVNNRYWHVKLIICEKFLGGQLSAGWSAFARENSLKPGDVCIFQLINSSDQTPLFNVSIMRDSGRCLITDGVDREVIKTQVPKVDDIKFEIPDEVFGKFSSSRKRKKKSTLPSSHQPRKKAKNVENFTNETGKGKNTQSMHKESDAKECICLGKPSFSNPPEAAKKYSTKNPFFEVAMTRSHFEAGATVNVPRNFMKNLELVTRIAQLQVDKRLWSLKLISYPHHAHKSVFFGWVHFARANSLKVGDVCSFELIDTRNLIIKVSINRQ